MSLKTYFCCLKLERVGKVTREHVNTQDILTREPVNTQGTLARE